MSLSADGGDIISQVRQSGEAGAYLLAEWGRCTVLGEISSSQRDNYRTGNPQGDTSNAGAAHPVLEMGMPGSLSSLNLETPNLKTQISEW